MVAILLVTLAGTLAPAAFPVPAAAQEPAPGPVRLDVAAMSPQVVTAAGAPELVVTGTVTNTGPDPVDALSLRVQRGAAVSGEAGLRSAFDGEAAVDDAVPPFVELGPLAPGASVPFRYVVPLTGPPGTSLALPGPGSYPLLVNLNGNVGGTVSRLAGIRTVLPVSALPGGPPAEPAAATPVSMLYPITDAPRRIPPVPGQVPVLTDDDLAASFAAGGRLRGLVDALGAGAPAGSPARSAVCLAVDPELVATAVAMRGGYEVVTGPDGATAPGRGAEAAGQWLTALQAVARGTCVIALPPSDADLVALVRGGEADLARRTLQQGREALAEQLGTPVLDDVVWPADGVLDEPTLQALGGGTRLLLSADGVSAGRDSGVVALGDEADPARAVLADPLLTEVAPGRGAAPPPGGLAGQNLAAALAFRAAEGGDGAGPLLVAPPHRWTAGGDAAAGVLSALSALIGDGRLRPVGLPGAATAPEESAQLFYPPEAGGAEIPREVVATIADQVRSIEGLRGAAEARTGIGATPTEVFDPLVRGTLRAASSWWRGDPARAVWEAGVVTGRIDQIRSSVRVVQPPSPYSLGTSNAPLLVTVANGLPVTMNVRVVLSSTTGLRVDPIPVQAVPPLGRVQVRVNTQVTRSGQFSVDAGLRTPDGADLGPDTRLRVRSTVYGTVTVWLTAIAGAVLVVLVVRRVVRRIRAARSASAGPGRGGPSGPDRPGGPAGPDDPDGRDGPHGPGGAPPAGPTGGLPTRPVGDRR
nr:DUF6049 family protein [Pseudonocardia sp. C8]